MSVYVDHASLPFRRMKMSHLAADTSKELHDMARRLGLGQYVQHAGQPNEHLDVSEPKRQEALRLGARPFDGRFMVGIIRRKRSQAPLRP